MYSNTSQDVTVFRWIGNGRPLASSRTKCSSRRGRSSATNMERSSATPVEMLTTEDRTSVVDLWILVTDCERNFKLAKTLCAKLIKYLELWAFSLRISWLSDVIAEICFAVSSLLRLMVCLQYNQAFEISNTSSSTGSESMLSHCGDIHQNCEQHVVIHDFSPEFLNVFLVKFELDLLRCIFECIARPARRQACHIFSQPLAVEGIEALVNLGKDACCCCGSFVGHNQLWVLIGLFNVVDCFS